MRNFKKEYDNKKIIKEIFRDSPFTLKNQNQILQLLNYCTNENKQKTGAPHNILIVANEYKKQIEYVRIIIEALSYHPAIKKNLVVLSADELEQQSFFELEKKYAAVIIDSFEGTAHKILKEKHNELENTAGLIKILCVNQPLAMSKLEGDEHLFYRIFANDLHIILEDMTTEDAKNILIKKLLDKGYNPSPEFEEEISEYIRVVYPKANLQELDFVNDLYNRIVTKMLIKSEFSEKIGKEEVPFYRKPEKKEASTEDTTENVLAETIEEKPITSKKSGKNKAINILVLSLSAIPNELKINRFIYEGKEYIGRYQLDPVPKILAEKLAQKGDCIDRVIMLETSFVKKSKKVVTPEGDTINTTAEAYFIDQIRPWVNPSLTDKEIFIPIDINEDYPAEGIAKTIEYIRKQVIVQNGKRIIKPNLYLDPHGGFRSVQLILEAIISLIKDEVRIASIYSVRFSDDKNLPNKIIDDDSSMKTFEFISAMNEFFMFGRCDSLKRYIGDSDLIKCIDKMSEGLRLCNVDQFEAGLREMKTLDLYRETIHSENNQDRDSVSFANKENERKKYLELFVEKMKKDYQKLYTETNYSNLDLISWSLKKGFYQQAVTIVESKMPREVFGNNLLQWNDNLNNYVKNTTDKKHHVDPSGFILHGFYYKKLFPEFNDNIDSDKEKRELLRRLPSTGETLNEKTIKSLKNNLQHLSVSEKDENGNKRWIQVRCKVKDQYLEDFARFLRMHMMLKAVRNKINHGWEEENMIPSEQIAVALRLYCKLWEKLTKNDVLKYTTNSSSPLTDNVFANIKLN